jgi:predicted Holliday junction resolvase-like endonuclease
MIEWLLIVVLFFIVIGLVAAYFQLRGEVAARAERLFIEWKEREEKRIREDAITRSTATILGKVGEQLAPLAIMSGYGVSLKELRFLGSPIDFIAFKGLTDKNPKKIMFFEVKSGKSTALTPEEKAIKELVEQKKVEWILVHVPTELEKLEKA